MYVEPEAVTSYCKLLVEGIKASQGQRVQERGHGRNESESSIVDLCYTMKKKEGGEAGEKQEKPSLSNLLQYYK